MNVLGLPVNCDRGEGGNVVLAREGGGEVNPSIFAVTGDNN